MLALFSFFISRKHAGYAQLFSRMIPDRQRFALSIRSYIRAEQELIRVIPEDKSTNGWMEALGPRTSRKGELFQGGSKNAKTPARWGKETTAWLRNFFPINAPGMGRFKLFDLVGYS